MESVGKDHGYSDSSLPPSAAREEYAVPDVIITRRLRDRELLRKRKAEAQEKDSIQEQKSKRQRRGRGARRGRGRQLAVEPSLEPEPEPASQPDSQEEAEPAPSGPAPPEPVQEQPSMLTIQDLVSGMQPGPVEEELVAGCQDPMAMCVPGEKRPVIARCAMPSCHGKLSFCILETGADWGTSDQSSSQP
ncbi:hemogen isoform X2 [Egretta garzetta]|uniref:hemogen isoform X2 n=1 Tax=Egretta garzetta TaxID=188379 RepID=UPI00163CBE3D|nr:hemogen isoform X2 [Egretta garzetta]